MAALLLLTACGGSSGGTAGSGPSGNLTWFFWVGSPAETQVWQSNANLVPKQYPNLKVNLVTTDWNSYWQKLPLEASTGSMPCIAGLQFGYVGSVGKDFIPLNSLIKKYGYSVKPFEPAMIQELSQNGNLLALPYDFGPVVIDYNKALFKQKGVPLPKAGWTWSEFVKDAQKLTGGGDYGYLPGLSMELGYDLTGSSDSWVKDGKFNVTNPAFVKGMEEQAQLSSKDHAAPTYSSSPNWATQEFDTGKVGMEVNGPWGLIDLKEQANFPVGWVQFPNGPEGMKTYNEGSGFGITKDCKNVPAAFKALTVLVGSQALTHAGSTGRAFPARLADDKAWASFAGPAATNVMTQALKGAPPPEVTTNWTAFQTAMLKYQPLLLNGSISAQQFADDVQGESGGGAAVSPGNVTPLTG